MESNVVMTLDTTCYSCKAGTSRRLNDWDGSMSADDGKWNDVAESSLHHTMCEYSNENVKEIGSKKQLHCDTPHFKILVLIKNRLN